jgi:hypothetical protein
MRAEFYFLDADFVANAAHGDVAAFVYAGKRKLLGGNHNTAVVVDLFDIVFVLHFRILQLILVSKG